jgi:preprotein translocase subunit YajC
MFASTAMAQTTTPSGGGGPQEFLSGPLGGILPIVAMMVLFYFLLIRPQQRRQKQHQELIKAVKRGDTVVLSSGIVGKVSKVEDAEVAVEIAQGVNVKVVKAMISDVRTRGEPAAANDTKS